MVKYFPLFVAIVCAVAKLHQAKKAIIKIGIVFFIVLIFSLLKAIIAVRFKIEVAPSMTHNFPLY